MKQQPKQLSKHSDSASKKMEVVPSAWRAIASVFWDAKGPISFRETKSLLKHIICTKSSRTIGKKIVWRWDPMSSNIRRVTSSKHLIRQFPNLKKIITQWSCSFTYHCYRGNHHMKIQQDEGKNKKKYLE